MKFNITVNGTYNGVELDDSLCRFIESIYPFLYNDEFDVRCSKKVYSYFIKHIDSENNELLQKSSELLENIIESKELYESNIKKNIVSYFSDSRSLTDIQCLVKDIAYICYDLINTDESYKDTVLKHWYDFITAISYNLFNSATKLKFENNILDVSFTSKFNKTTRYNNVIISSVVYNIMKMYSEADRYGTDCTHAFSGWVDGAMNEPIVC